MSTFNLLPFLTSVLVALLPALLVSDEDFFPSFFGFYVVSFGSGTDLISLLVSFSLLLLFFLSHCCGDLCRKRKALSF